MGEFLGLTERTFRQYEAGEVDPPSSKAAKLAAYFDVSIDYLLGHSNDPERRFVVKNQSIDVYLLDEALKIGGLETKEDTVNLALEEFIKARKAADIFGLFGEINPDGDHDHALIRRTGV
jgi:transcriptional regulator with XRE-family HTH domain